MRLRWSDFVVVGVAALLVSMIFWPGAMRDGAPVTPVTRVTVVTVPVAPHVIYVPVGDHVCPAEDSCRVDYDGRRWVIIPGGDE